MMQAGSNSALVAYRTSPETLPGPSPDREGSAVTILSEPAAAGGSMIRHAPQAALCPVGPLPVAVIEPSLRAVLVFPVGNPHLLASHPASAPLSAVDLPPVAASADVKPHSATRPSAKQLDPCHFAGHTPHDSIAACEPCRVGGDTGGIDLGLGGVGEWTERIGRKHEC